MKKLILLLVLLPLNQGQALEYFTKIPRQDVVHWFKQETSKPQPFKIHYYWATWCGPCVISAKQLQKIKSQYSIDASIYAYSDETTEVIEKYLKETYPQDYPFFYAQILTKEESNPSSLRRFVDSYPYIFVTYNDELVWHGNPTYPPKVFDEFLKMWAEKKWTKEYVLDKNKIHGKDLEEITNINSTKDKTQKQLVQLEQQLYETYRRIYQGSKNYIYFRYMAGAHQDGFKLAQKTMSKADRDQANKTFLAERKKLYQEAAKDFASSREDLFYIARDLLSTEKDDQDLALTEDIINKAMVLPEEGTTYPDYNLWVTSLLHQKKGELSLAREYVTKAIDKCKTQIHCPQFIDIYEKALQEIDKTSKYYCDGFISCIVRGFSLFVEP